MKKANEYSTLFKNISAEWKWLLQVMSRYRFEIVIYTLMGVVGIAMGLGASVASKYLIDAVVGHNSGTVLSAGALVIGLAVLQIVINTGNSFISSRVGTRVSNEIRFEIYDAMATSYWEGINKYHSGELVNRLEGDVSSVSGNVISFLPNLITKSVQFFGCLSIVLYYDATLAFFALMSAPVLFFSSRFMTKMMRKYNLETRQMNGKVLSFSEESIQNLQTIKAFGLTTEYAKKFKVLLNNYRNMRLKHDKFSILTTLCLSAIGLVVSYSCYGWGVYRLWDGAITFGTMTLTCEVNHPLTLQPITPNADYRENTEVITSYWLKNSYSDDYTPAEDVSIKFCVYKGSNLIYSWTKSKVVVPGDEYNLIYFKWTVPTGLSSADVKITGEIIDDGSSYNKITKNYSTTPYLKVQTPDTQFEKRAPLGFTIPDDNSVTGTACEWWEYIYENDRFVKKHIIQNLRIIRLK